MEKRIGIICNISGHQIGGQTTKSDEICRYFGEKYSDVYVLNVFHKNVIVLLIEIIKVMRRFTDVIIVLSSRGFFTILPLLIGLKKMYHCKIHEIVIGGVRQDFLKKRKISLRLDRTVDYIYVESEAMVQKYNGLGLSNVVHLPNFKTFEDIDIEQCKHKRKGYTVRLCTFSRIDKNKGIDSAVEIVQLLNAGAETRSKYLLDIYGPIDENYQEEFRRIMLSADSSIVYYKGIEKTENAQQVLMRYDVLLFPTHWKTEGFPGTFIDALSAGLPIIASRRSNFEDVITDGKNGFLVDEYDLGGFCKRVREITDNVPVLHEYKQRALESAKAYKTENVLSGVRI